MSDFSDEINNVYTVLSKNMGKGSLLEIRRLLHGRGGTWEGCSFLNVDFFPPALLITLYEERNDLWKDTLSELLLKHDNISVVVFQDRSRVPWTNRVLGGVLPDPHIVEENHLKYSVSLKRGENPGIFSDMRDGRSYVRQISKGKKVLNLFSYTCAFSVAAVEGGARSVLNMDMNSNSLSRGRENHQLNHHEKSKVNYLSHNILKSFGKIRKYGPFDLVIIDPPPSQGSSFNLERDYGKILRKTPEFLAENGEIFACLNSPNFDFQWFQSFIEKNLGKCEIIKKMGAGENFPEKISGSGLKIYHLLLL